MYSEQQIAYLHSMGITLWIPKDEACFEDTLVSPELRNTEGGRSSADSLAYEAASRNDGLSFQVREAELTEQEPLPGNSDISSQFLKALDTKAYSPDEQLIEASNKPKLECNVPLIEARRDESEPTTLVQEDSTADARCYLVLPKSRQWVAGELAVLCRHDGHPAESFIRRGLPSKTVSNMLAGLSYLLHDDVEASFINACNFAQVTATPLSELAMPLEAALSEQAPKAMIVFGSSTANLLMNCERPLAQWQLKTWRTEQGIPFVVTHHPYDVYKDPLLKKQVYKDLQMLAKLIQQS